ncbi:MAG: dienelactone hydrolase family protein [Aggregatilineales bacterium]
MARSTSEVNLAEMLSQSVLSVLGAPPDSAPLEPQVLDVVERPHYRREHVKYQLSPNQWGYAYLLIPKGVSLPCPAVICHHSSGNFAAGKEELVDEARPSVGVELARLGYVVMAPDAFGYGERRSPNSNGAAYDAAYTLQYHTVLLLRGETMLRHLLSDISRAVDYLLTRPEVDGTRLGFIGQSYGARMALWAAAFEPRLVATVAHGSLMSYRETVRQNSWFQIEFVVPRLMQVADLHHILSLVAPRPFLLSTIEGDAHSTDAAEIYRRALPAYQKLGVPQRLAHYTYPHGNGFELPMRYKAYTWLNSWLKPY